MYILPTPTKSLPRPPSRKRLHKPIHFLRRNDSILLHGILKRGHHHAVKNMFLPHQRDIQPLVSVVPRWQQLWVLFTLNQQTRHDAHGQVLHGTTAVKRIGVERRRQPHQTFAM